MVYLVKVMRIILFVSMLFNLAIVPVVFAQQEVKITNGEWMPYLSEHLPNYGVASQIVTEAFNKAGYDVTYGFFPWTRAYEQAAKGTDWQASVIWTKSPEREDTFIFSGPIIKLKDVFFYLKSNEFDWNSINDLDVYRIGLTSGYFYGQELDDAEKAGKLNVERVRNDVLSFRKLYRGRIDIFAASEYVGYSLIKENFKSSEAYQFTTHSKPVRVVNYYLLMSKNVPNAQSMINAFNQGLEELEAEGRMEEIITASSGN